MKLLAFNGSPRKTWNTATLLKNACEGAESAGAEARLIHLAELDFSGCTSCFACKRLGGNSYGQCAVNDELTPILEEVKEADAIILGTPVYFGTETGLIRNFMERLLFPYITYSEEPNLFPRVINTGLIYTMGSSEEQMPSMGFQGRIDLNKFWMQAAFGNTESLISYDTYQFSDYSLFKSDIFDTAAKAKRREKVFPKECEAAFAMGARFCKGK